MKRLLIAAAATAGLLALGACNNDAADEDMAADDAAEAGADASADGGMAGGSGGGSGGAGGGGAASAGESGADAASGGAMASGAGGSTGTSQAGGGSTPPAETDGQAYDPVTQGQGGSNLEGEVRRPTEPEHPARGGG